MLSTPHTQAAGYIAMQSYIDGSTNKIIVGSSTNMVSVVSANVSNVFNLPGFTYNTNLWPVLQFPDPVNLQAFRNLSLATQFASQDTNICNLIIRVAASADNAHWVSNYAVITILANGTSTVSTNNNIDTIAMPFLALQSIANTNSTVAITNLVLQPVAKPGI